MMKFIKNTIFAGLFLLLTSALAQAQEICTIAGSAGPCQVTAFLRWETKTDSEFKCSKLKNTTYLGTCETGRLEGLAILTRPRAGNNGIYKYVGYFDGGKVLYPFIEFNKTIVGVHPADNTSLGCQNFIASWDWSDRVECRKAMEVFGSEALSKNTWRTVNAGKASLEIFSTGKRPPTIGVAARGPTPLNRTESLPASPADPRDSQKSPELSVYLASFGYRTTALPWFAVAGSEQQAREMMERAFRTGECPPSYPGCSSAKIERVLKCNFGHGAIVAHQDERAKVDLGYSCGYPNATEAITDALSECRKVNQACGRSNRRENVKLQVRHFLIPKAVAGPERQSKYSNGIAEASYSCDIGSFVAFGQGFFLADLSAKERCDMNPQLLGDIGRAGVNVVPSPMIK